MIMTSAFHESGAGHRNSTDADSEILTAQAVSASYLIPTGRTLKVLEEVSLTIRRGEIVAIVGPSGCGKSTLLRILSGIVLPQAGNIIYGHNLSRTSSIPMVLQTPALLPWRTVIGNIAIGLEILGNAEATLQSHRYAKLVGLTGFEQFLARELSGGMQARVAVARALAVAPPLVLLDEPFSQLDEITRESLTRLLCEQVEENHLSAVLVGHNIDEAVRVANRIIVLSKRPGRVILNLSIPQDRPRMNTRRLSPDAVQFAKEIRRIAREFWT